MDILSKTEVFELIDSIDSAILNFDRVRPHNRGEIRRPDTMDKQSFKEMVSLAIEEEHQYGGDIEIEIPSVNKTLVGHHDGKYWLE